MHPRKNIIEIFSTFLEFAADRFCGWATDAQLRRSMQRRLQQTPQATSENFWVNYWYKALQKNQIPKLAKQHLTAYLQESCFWSSQKISTHIQSHQYSLSDCFQIAIAQVDRVLRGFNPDQGSSLKNYAGVIFNSAILETLRQRHEVDICTDWGLLRKISQKRLTEALQATGLPTQTVNAYITAWNCFRSLYAPTQNHTTRKLTRPNSQTWEAIATVYNSQSSAPINPKTLETWLLKCAQVIRNYLYPHIISINAPRGTESNSEWLDNFSANEQDSLNLAIIQEEQQIQDAQQSEINKILASAVHQLETQVQQILQLYYTQGLTQQQIAHKLQIQQYTVSRRLTKARESLLKCLALWSQEKLHISVSSDLLKNMSVVMEEWLQVYFSIPTSPDQT